MSEVIASFTLVRYPPRAITSAMTRMATDRQPLARTPGVRFWRLLGSGRGDGFDPRPDLERWGLFAVWQSPAALDAFEATSPLMARYRRDAREVWTARLQPVRAHGAWSGVRPFRPDELAPPRGNGAPAEGPWAILTRAAIRPSRLWRFWRAVPAVAERLRSAGAIASVGVGEWPLMTQATFSLWRTLPEATTFAYGSDQHRDVIGRTRGEAWYREELFARFRPIASSGTWDGRDPLAGLL